MNDAEKVVYYERVIGDMMRSATAGLCSFGSTNWYHFLKEVRNTGEAAGFSILGIKEEQKS